MGSMYIIIDTFDAYYLQCVVDEDGDTMYFSSYEEAEEWADRELQSYQVVEL